ncbi:lymphocyte antigen 86 isoform X1 [Lontra canadensis]|uniref:lymphocyte antigen 86 isoform X1 n=1 Tax=Lontra canadensis TaxID=76717 RepID=UPI0013F36CA5|nr:lymphocyte antigen 86 isoform X1 [Lontra canadensis]
MQGLAMKGLTVAVLVWTLISPSSGTKGWPTHTVCRDGNLEVLYQSCDPLQDFGFSVDQCSKHLKSNLNIRFGMILREDIKELFLDIALFTKGSSILNFSYPICEEDLPKFSFCGRRKGGACYQSGFILQDFSGACLIPLQGCLGAQEAWPSPAVLKLTHISHHLEDLSTAPPIFNLVHPQVPRRGAPTLRTTSLVRDKHRV